MSSPPATWKGAAPPYLSHHPIQIGFELLTRLCPPYPPLSIHCSFQTRTAAARTSLPRPSSLHSTSSTSTRTCRAKSGLFTWTLLKPPGIEPRGLTGLRAQAPGPVFVLSSAVLLRDLMDHPHHLPAFDAVRSPDWSQAPVSVSITGVLLSAISIQRAWGFTACAISQGLEAQKDFHRGDATSSTFPYSRTCSTGTRHLGKEIQGVNNFVE